MFGLLIGSFLNACIYRLPRRISIVAPRSFCPQCNASIAWYDNIPLLSFCLLRGRCRRCHQPIPWRYPVNEILLALLFCAIVYRWGITIETSKWAVFSCLMVVLFWTDVETRLLPDILTLGGLVAALLFALGVPMQNVLVDIFFPRLGSAFSSEVAAVTAAVLLSVPLWLFSEGYAWLRKITPVGLGDIKLLALLGAFLGLQRGLLALIFGSAGGTIIGLSYIWATGKSAKTEPLPYGSFLCAAGLIALFWGPELFSHWWSV
ncbi:MAG TPA: prepilin peptidase [Bryobacteraceae bacterium]|jgi:leader peptidase (prepilin peptidase)/N-methyltransferase